MSVIQAVIAVWTQLLGWMSGAFGEVTKLFWDGEALTFIGVFASVMAGIAVVLLIFNLIRSFLPMRG